MFILEADPVSVSLLNVHAEAHRATNQIAWLSMFLICHFSAQKCVLPLPVKVISLNSLTAFGSRAKGLPFIYTMQVYTEQMPGSPKKHEFGSFLPACLHKPAVALLRETLFERV